MTECIHCLRLGKENSPVIVTEGDSVCVAHLWIHDHIRWQRLFREWENIKNEPKL